MRGQIAILEKKGRWRGLKALMAPVREATLLNAYAMAGELKRKDSRVKKKRIREHGGKEKAPKAEGKCSNTQEGNES